MTNLKTFISEGEKEPEYKKIWMSDVVVTRKRNLFFGRKWNSLDVVTVVWVLTVHFLTLFAPFTFTRGAFWAAFWCYASCGMLGLTLSYHRNLAINGLKLPKWLEYTFAYFGVQAAQGPDILVSIHRSHHQYVDSERDPHSPTYGFWFSHIGWLFDSGYIVEKYKERKNVEDLKSQPFYRFIKRTYLWHILGFAMVVNALGGFSYLLWVVGVRIWGNRVWNTNDLSKNNLWVALFTFGEGWHNNHHAFEYYARLGLQWWEIDLCWWFIVFLESVGLATNVKLPTEAHKLKRSFTSVNN